ncbi:hypothetical protein GW777_06860 [Candidatus Peregrinibacteria bacterium]|nr:hypothetical protein [Candidatus Parcubacteria bacterium]NCS68073.1 hypothetical protein [Candidatus Peregrinibacteria bacterium]PIX85814.1 MAG: hypothetical protein COZ32_06605 [Nitrospirae bacterium CG_4_10_14_3_um_filter_53_41]
MYYQQLLKKEFGIIISLIIVLCFVGQSFAFTNPPYITVTKPTPTATKTVCSSGCDYATLSAANSAAQPGWLIKVKAGTYSGNFTWTALGISGNEIVIEAFGDGNATFTLTGSEGFIITDSYVIFDGVSNRQLVFDGTNQGDKIIFQPYGSATNHLTLSRLTIKNAGLIAASSWSTAGIRVYGDYMKIYNCEVYGSSGVGIYGVSGKYHEVRNNIVHDNYGTGIQYNPHPAGVSADEVTVAGNAIYGNGKLFGDCETTNVNDCRPGISILSNENSLYNIYIYNNILWDNHEAGIKVDNPATNMVARIYNNTVYNNIVYGL